MQWSSFINNWWQRQIPSAGNACSITSICEIYEMRIHDPLYVHVGQVIIYGRPDAALVGVAAHDVLLSSFLSSGKRLWNSDLRNNSISLNNSRCIRTPVVYRAVKLCPLCHKAEPGAQVWFLYRPCRCCVLPTTESVHAMNPNPL